MTLRHVDGTPFGAENIHEEVGKLCEQYDPGTYDGWD